MNKHAAEKIAQEYYNLGLQLSRQRSGLEKVANPMLRRLGAGLGMGALSPAAYEALTRATVEGAGAAAPSSMYGKALLDALANGKGFGGVLPGLQKDLSGAGEYISNMFSH